MRFFSLLLLAALWLLFTTASPAGAVVINSSTIISEVNSFPDDIVQVNAGNSPPTVVQMIDGGDVCQFTLNDDSVLNFHGGRIKEVVYLRDQSEVNLLAGTLPRLSVNGDAVANVYTGTIADLVTMSGAHGTPSLHVLGGQLEDVQITGGRVSVHSGYMEWVRISSSSMRVGVLNISGGSLDRFTLSANAIAHLSGGDIRANFSTLRDNSDLHVYGHKLTYGQDIAGIWLLNGTLLDGTELTNFYVDQLDSSSVILHNVPEPATAAILALGLSFALLWRRGRMKRSSGL
jgi:hypothetical protein